MSMTALKNSYPQYTISKNKIELDASTPVDSILEKTKTLFANADVNTIDGVKLDFPTEWVHLRKSNTEPIIRIYAESNSKEAADALAERVMKEIQQLID
jgi:phosphomannomutase